MFVVERCAVGTSGSVSARSLRLNRVNHPVSTWMGDRPGNTRLSESPSPK